MTTHQHLLFRILAAVVAPLAVLGAQAPTPPTNANSCGDVLAFQVLLDRQGFSPGQIDGRPGANLRRAISAFQEVKGLTVSGQPDCSTWEALGGPAADAITTTYEITARDVEGPFEPNIPAGLDRQALLPALPYRSPTERLAEQFHVAPALLSQMNRGKSFSAGTSITVPTVSRFDPETKPTRNPAATDVRIEVSKDDSSLRVYRADNSLLFFAPVASGSEHDPLPIGQWKVTSVLWMPEFHYNPDLFWDADPTHSKATLKPGPNNPVGVVWIDLSRPHYGLHGTPEPSKIGHTETHGCVRLTNWDAAKVAEFAKVGTPVIFK